MPKVIYREVTSVDILGPLFGFDRGLQLKQVVVIAGGKELVLEPQNVEMPSRWILEKMRDDRLDAWYVSRDFHGWQPHPTETFDQWGITHTSCSPQTLPEIEIGDYLVIESSGGGAAVFKVCAPPEVKAADSEADV